MRKVNPYITTVRSSLKVLVRFAEVPSGYLSRKELLDIYVDNGGCMVIRNALYQSSVHKELISKEEVAAMLAKQIFGVMNKSILPPEAEEILDNIEWG